MEVQKKDCFKPISVIQQMLIRKSAFLVFYSQLKNVVESRFGEQKETTAMAGVLVVVMVVVVRVVMEMLAAGLPAEVAAKFPAESADNMWGKRT